MKHGHIEYIPLTADLKRAETFARQQLKYCREIKRQRRKLRFKRWMDRLYPLLVLLGMVAVFGLFVIFSAH